MRFVLVTALKDLRRRFRDPAALLIWIGIPLVIGTLMSLLNGGGDQPVRAHVLLVDEDGSATSRLAVAAGRQGRLGQFLEIEEVSAAEGQRRMAKGDATALLTIPKGFQEGVFNERPTELTLVTNPAQRILPLIVEEGLHITVEAAFYLQRLFGATIRDIAAGPAPRDGIPSDDRVAEISRAINQRLTRLRTTLLPPVMSVEMKAEAQGTSGLDFGTLLVPGLLFMSLLFMAQGTNADIWIEKERGTLRRALSTPQSTAHLLAGKIAATTVLMALVTLVALIMCVTIFKILPARIPLALAWACYTGAALTCYFMLLQLMSSSARGGSLASIMVVFPLMMIGGSFFPFEIMPPWMANIGRWTPNGLAVTRMKEILLGQPNVKSMAVAGVMIGVLAAAAFLASVRRLRGRFATT